MAGIAQIIAEETDLRPRKIRLDLIDLAGIACYRSLIRQEK